MLNISDIDAPYVSETAHSTDKKTDTPNRRFRWSTLWTDFFLDNEVLCKERCSGRALHVRSKLPSVMADGSTTHKAGVVATKNHLNRLKSTSLTLLEVHGCLRAPAWNLFQKLDEGAYSPKQNFPFFPGSEISARGGCAKNEGLILKISTYTHFFDVESDELSIKSILILVQS